MTIHTRQQHRARRRTARAPLRTLVGNRDAQRQGAALIIALFALLAITGLGLVAIQTSTEEIQASGNYKFTKNATQSSAAALDVALGEIAVNGPAYWETMRRTAFKQVEDGNVTDTLDWEASYEFPDSVLEPLVFPHFGGDANSNILNPDLNVVMSDPVDGFGVAGYSSDFCFKRFKFTASATVGTLPSDVEYTGEKKIRYAQAQHQATGVMGPIECEGN